MAAPTAWVSEDFSELGVRQRSQLLQPAFDLYSGLAVGALAAAAYMGLIHLGSLPSPQSSVTLFVSATVGAVVALPVYWLRSRAEADGALQWFAAGLSVATVALLLQLFAFPTITQAGGLFHTDPQSSAALYLLFHISLFGGALAGTISAPLKALGPCVVVGCLVAAVLATNRVPLPTLLGPSQSFTTLLTVIDGVIVALGVAAIAMWSRHSGRRSSVLRGWVAISMSFALYELVLNGLSAGRFDALWWGSATLRMLTFAVLAGGGIHYLATRLSRIERFSEDELALRDQELAGSTQATLRLLNSAKNLAASLTPVDVAHTLCASLYDLIPGMDVAVYNIDQDRTKAVLLARAGPGAVDFADTLGLDEDSTLAAAVRTSKPHRSTPGDVSTTMSRTVLPLRVASLTIGTVVLAGTTPAAPSGRALIQGLADQGGPALSRARLFARERQAAETLQRALLPTNPVDVRGLTTAALYRPAVSDTRVGGDWYDCIALDDGRVALVVGDVVGKGLRAAGVMGQLRSALRALISVDPSPSRVMGWLDAAAAQNGSEMVATALYVLVDPVNETARVCRAGHMPLALKAPSQTCVLIEGGGPPLGLNLVDDFPEQEVAVPSGSILVLFTDGLVEERGTSLADGLDRLRAALSAEDTHALAPDEIARWLLSLSESTGEADDVAVLVAKTEHRS